MADHDGDGVSDLYLLTRGASGTGSTEVHVLSGASAYQSFLVHTGTPLSPTQGQNWSFAVVDFNRDRVPDLVAIKRESTGTNQTEAHVLSGASGFQSWVLHTATGMGLAPSASVAFAAR